MITIKTHKIGDTCSCNSCMRTTSKRSGETQLNRVHEIQIGYRNQSICSYLCDDCAKMLITELVAALKKGESVV